MCQHQGAQHRNPGTRVVALAPQAHNMKPWFLHHMLINPHSATLNQLDIQEGSMLAQNPFKCDTVHHRKASCVQEKQNLTQERQKQHHRQTTADNEVGDNSHGLFSR